MTRWLITLSGAEADLAQLVEWRDGEGWRIERNERHGVVLSAQRFEDENNYEIVGRMADALISRINTSAKHCVPDFQGVKRNNSIEQREGQGRVVVRVYLAVETATAAALGSVKFDSDGTILETSEDRTRDQQANEIRRLVALQEAHPDVGAALKYLQDEPDMYGLYKAAEAIDSTVRRWKKWDAPVKLGWISRANLDRFRRSTQTKRHHEYIPPKKPMKLSEADACVRDLLAKLIDHLESLP